MNNIFPEAPPASEQQIIQEAHDLFLAHHKVFGSQHILDNGISFNEIFDSVIYPRTEVRLNDSTYLGNDENGYLILGRFDPYNNIVYINKQLIDDNDPRLIFTAFHEAGGHAVLHGEYLRENKRNHPELNTTALTIQHEEMQPFEWQANTFAANLAAPIPFIRLLCKLHFEVGYDRSFIYTKPCVYNLNFMGSCERVKIHSKNHLARVIAKKIKRFFGGLSTESLSYQVEKAVIKDVSYCGSNNYQDYSVQCIGECIKTLYN